MNLKHDSIMEGFVLEVAEKNSNYLCFALLVLNLTFELKISLSSFIITCSKFLVFVAFGESISSISHIAFVQKFC